MKYGRFSEDNLEFIVTDPAPPRPWVNYLTNEAYCAICSQAGGGYSFYRDCRSYRILRWLPANYLTDRPGRYIYLRDTQSKRYWSATYQPIRKKPTAYQCLHGLGYTVIETAYEGISHKIVYFVPRRDPCEVWLVEVTNRSNRVRSLEVFPYVEWLLGDYHLELRYRNIMNLYNRAWWDQKLKAILAKKTAAWRLMDIQPFPYFAFFGSSLPVARCGTRKGPFVGSYNTEESPEAVIDGNFKNSPLSSGEDSIGAYLHKIKLLPKATKRFTIILGQAESKQKVKRLLATYRDLSSAEEELENVKELWRKRILNSIIVQTPDKKFDTMINVWVKYQLYICNFWSRSPSYYHEGTGGRGYRDSCQDAEAIASIDPEYARRKILTIATLIREDGTTAPGWSDTRGPHIYRPNKDHPVWLAATVASYVKETGDKSILLEKVPYLEDRWRDGGSWTDPGWNKGSIRVGSGTVFEHLKKNLEFTFKDVGERGLPRIGHADWNDAIDAAGIKGKGDSVWLAMALVRSLRLLAELAELIEEPEEARRLRARAREMSERINSVAWDGRWYVRGFTDDGTVYGSNKNREGKIFLNTQSWAIMSGVADHSRRKKLLASVDRYLDGPHGMALFWPAYSKYDPRLGRITMFSEGTKENAAVFCHAATWKVLADCIAGRGSKAYESMKKLMPNSQPDYEVYKAEPYVFAEYMVGPEHLYRYGEGAFTWVTGTAGLTFVVATEWLLGVRKDYEGLRIDPCIPSHWKRCRVTRPFRGAHYEITIENSKGKEKGLKLVYVDGKPIEGNLVKPHSDQKTHRVRAVMG